MVSRSGTDRTGELISLAGRRPMKDAYVLRHSLVGGNPKGFFPFEPEIDERTQARLSGDMLSDAEIAALPRQPRMIIEARFGGTTGIPAVFGFLAALLFITPKIRDLLENLEPGVHRFLPIDLHSTVEIAGRTEHGEHYILLPPPLVDCLVVAETDFWMGYGIEGWIQGENGIGGGGLSPTEGKRCTLRRSEIEGRHLWRTKVGESSEYTCSDRFWDAVRDEVMIWAPRTRCLLK
ncbi:imm11 family protein [Stappia sp.]|uniref:imm11 family protein n=1 Tax=Stappia sp. TaxID=1870903 RepID=UPI003D0BEFCB